MSDNFRKQVYRNLRYMETDELVEIWQTNDRLEWTDTAFDVIREILQERLEELPPQNEPVYETGRPKEITTMTLVQVYFSFSGRIGRQTYWLKGILPIAVVSVVVGFIEEAIPTYSAYSGVPTILWQLLAIWPSLALTVKRWHDRNKSGWWVLIGLIPIAGGILALIETGLLKGTEGPNRFGSKTF